MKAKVAVKESQPEGVFEVAKLTSKGQVTIPVDVRKSLGVDRGDRILFIRRAGEVIVKKA